ncbi:hypothetical protein CEXT_330661 [Caerostris extrusa]|uniref:Uncharacterized protein n=1 Tax=Caerostris extrusa TaxID=172846 RepID=A0AAV4N477_CAEEX|nr:hypothetical protein CEXT_330661 [Caerostris extrusa]
MRENGAGRTSRSLPHHQPRCLFRIFPLFGLPAVSFDAELLQRVTGLPFSLLNGLSPTEEISMNIHALNREKDIALHNLRQMREKRVENEYLGKRRQEGDAGSERGKPRSAGISFN